MASTALTNVRDPFATLTEPQRYRIIQPTDPWTDQYAVTLVRSSVEDMENFLQQSGHLTRFTKADEQYVAWRPQRMWEGSRKKRASIPVFLLFSQLQALLPNVLSALFPLSENVDIAPRPGSTLEQAKAAWELIMAQLDSLGEAGITRFRSIAMECFTQAFLYGNGVIEISWLYKILRKLVFSVDWEAQRQWVTDPQTGQPIVAPVGPPQRIVREHEQEFILNQPHIATIDIRDFLTDPQATTPDINHPSMRFCGVRSYPTVGELTQYRGQYGFKIPDDRTLIKLADEKPYTASEQAKVNSASTWGRAWNASNDFTTNPYDKRVELVRWYSNDRCVWLLNRTWAAYNRANIYQFKPFLNAFYVPFPNRYHGIALADVTEGDQHMIASLLESRLDELSLALNAPFVRKQGTMIGNPGTLAMSPSKVIDVNDDPEKAIKRLDVQAQTQTAMIETNDVYARSARTTGLSDIAVMGVPQAGGNSANRTAAGINSQTQAASMRIMFLVENSQASLIEPLCTILHQFNIRFLPRNMMIPIMGADGKQQMIDPVNVLMANPRFTMRAAKRMQARNALMQVLPWFVQTLLNPELLGMMQTQYNQKLNVNNLIMLITDTLNVPNITLFEPMSPEEIQKAQAPPPQAQMEMEKQRQRLEAMAEMAQDRDDKELLQQVLKTFGTPRVAESVLGFEDVDMEQVHVAKAKAKQKPNGKARTQ